MHVWLLVNEISSRAKSFPDAAVFLLIKVISASVLVPAFQFAVNCAQLQSAPADNVLVSELPVMGCPLISVSMLATDEGIATVCNQYRNV